MQKLDESESGQMLDYQMLKNRRKKTFQRWKVLNMLASQRREEILVGSDVAERINRVGGKVKYDGDNGDVDDDNDVDSGDIDDNNGQVLLCC